MSCHSPLRRTGVLSSLCMVCASFFDLARSYNSCALRRASHGSEVLIHFKQVLSSKSSPMVVPSVSTCHVSTLNCTSDPALAKVLSHGTFSQRTTLVSLSTATDVALQNLYPNPYSGLRFCQGFACFLSWTGRSTTMTQDTVSVFLDWAFPGMMGGDEC